MALPCGRPWDTRDSGPRCSTGVVDLSLESAFIYGVGVARCTRSITAEREKICTHLAPCLLGTRCASSCVLPMTAATRGLEQRGDGSWRSRSRHHPAGVSKHAWNDGGARWMSWRSTYDVHRITGHVGSVGWVEVLKFAFVVLCA